MVMATRLCREGRGRMGRSLHLSQGFPLLRSTVGVEIMQDQTSSWLFLCSTSLSVLDGGYVNISVQLSHYQRIKIPSNNFLKMI